MHEQHCAICSGRGGFSVRTAAEVGTNGQMVISHLHCQAERGESTLNTEGPKQIQPKCPATAPLIHMRLLENGRQEEGRWEEGMRVRKVLRGKKNVHRSSRGSPPPRQFLSPMLGSSQPPRTPALEDLMPSAGLYGHCTHTAHINTQVHTYV